MYQVDKHVNKLIFICTHIFIVISIVYWYSNHCIIHNSTLKENIICSLGDTLCLSAADEYSLAVSSLGAMIW